MNTKTFPFCNVAKELHNRAVNAGLKSEVKFKATGNTGSYNQRRYSASGSTFSPSKIIKIEGVGMARNKAEHYIEYAELNGADAAVAKLKLHADAMRAHSMRL